MSNKASRKEGIVRRFARRLNRHRLHIAAQLRLRAAVRAVAGFPRVKSQQDHRLPAPLIITLTSYPPRFPMLANTIKSLLDQSMRADRLVLWITHEDMDALPDDVRALEQHGLEIRGSIEMRSYKKLVPALLAFPDAFLVTADDDVYYPPRWLATLVESLDPQDPKIVSARAHMARLDENGRFIPYINWEFDTQSQIATGPSKLLFPTGGAGTLYPRHASQGRGPKPIVQLALSHSR
ncbi:MAG: hypothetical protein ACMVO5_09090 [Polymorphobacter sp.]|uniref:hypothetical protein n=1 Tax=Polymorphobacter sp. TaxID=1909290 RepID=UPI003A88234B